MSNATGGSFHVGINAGDLASLMKVCRDYMCEISIYIEPDGHTSIDMKPWTPTKYKTISEIIPGEGET